MLEAKIKYKVNDFVWIDRIFSTEVNVQGVMEKLKKPKLARVIHVEYTSLGPSYKLELLEDPTLSLRIRYWEKDIICAFEI